MSTGETAYLYKLLFTALNTPLDIKFAYYLVWSILTTDLANEFN